MVAWIPFPKIKVVSKLFSLAAKLAHAQAYWAVGGLDFPVVTARTPLCGYLAHYYALSNPSVSAQLLHSHRFVPGARE